ncbi:alpha/beta-hydrolase [Xylariaceae sp. FL0255]|nr:alpha/beta-hydrolase [Xylariaceae sp. FL0255]
MNVDSKPKLSVAEVLHLIYALTRTISVACITLLTGLFRGESGHKVYFRHVAHATLRALNGVASIRELQAVQPSTVEAYTAFAKEQGFEPDIVNLLGSSGKLLWLGDSEASNVLVCLHGGGFVFPARTQFQLYWDLRKQSHNEEDYAIALLAYSLVPAARYPVQLTETIALLRYLVEEKGKDPQKITISGDSAGALLALGAISHILHPHPAVQPLKLSFPLAGIALISPWVTPRVNADCAKRNTLKDTLSKEIVDGWGALIIRVAQEDEYNTPLMATAEWWAGTDTVVKDTILTAGRQEILFDDIETFTGRF